MIRIRKYRIAACAALYGKAVLSGLYCVVKGLLTHGGVIFAPFTDLHWTAEGLSNLLYNEYLFKSSWRKQQQAHRYGRVMQRPRIGRVCRSIARNGVFFNASLIYPQLSMQFYLTKVNKIKRFAE